MHDMDRFGNRWNQTGPQMFNASFTGKERDSETGLDNFKARFFGSSMGGRVADREARAAILGGVPSGICFFKGCGF